MFEFKIKNNCKNARTGFFNTLHGKIKTPNLAIVATHGKIKLLNKIDHLRANPNLIIANTFHLFINDKIKEIKKAVGLHKWSGFKKPIITDSGGFQVFSLGWGKIHGIGKIIKNNNNQFQKIQESFLFPEYPRQFIHPRQSIYGEHGQTASTIYNSRRIASKVKISENGAIFNFNNKKYELTPESSIKIQQNLGADIIFAFDECTSPLHDYSYTKKAMERTHRWALRCLAANNNQSTSSLFGGEEFNGEELAKKRSKKQQALFGIVQGGIFEDLRKKSSEFIGSLDFDGFGIGGSFGEKQMQDVLRWALSGLPEEKPRHLLGIGKIKDIFIAVKQGIDLFDCVVATREARHGIIYAKSGKLAIKKGIFSQDKKLLDKNCGCWVCRNRITRQEIHYYFKQKDINIGDIRVNPFLKKIEADKRGISEFRSKIGRKELEADLYGNNPRQSVSNIKAKRLATIHNIYFFKNLFREIQEAIVDKKLGKLEKEYYSYIK